MSVTLLPDAIWLHCILPRLSSDKDKMALLCTSKAMVQLIPHIIFTPIYDFTVRHDPFSIMIHRNYQAARKLLMAMRIETSGALRLDVHRTHAVVCIGVSFPDVFERWIEKIPRAILDRELAHPVQLA